jgi:hypothetical protein
MPCDFTFSKLHEPVGPIISSKPTNDRDYRDNGLVARGGDLTFRTLLNRSQSGSLTVRPCRLGKGAWLARMFDISERWIIFIHEAPDR